jgi:amino acid permease
MRATTKTTWRSPLSILMGARRNDDIDLELREDSLLPSPDALPSTPAADSRKSRSSAAAYIPFSYFGLHSPAPAADNAGMDAMTPSPGPPLGAFPPPITPISTEGDYVLDDGHGNLHYQHKTSHPWYNKLDLTLSCYGQNSSQNVPEEYEYDATEKKGIIDIKQDNKRFRQKAIIGTTLNFTNSIIGAGAMGLGGAFAASGGLISIICLICFASLTKLSLDLIVDLSSSPDIINKARFCNDYDNNSDSSSYYDSPKFNEFNGEKDKVESLKNGDEFDSPSIPNFNEQNRSDQIIDNPFPQNTESDSSPLMAQGEGIESNKYCHPLLLPHEQERYDILVMDLSQLNISTENTPQHDFLTRNNDNNGEATFTPPCTYEELGRAAYGSCGRLAVLISKSLYSFGCLIAYVVVVRDNFGQALRRVINSDNSHWLNDDNFLAFWLSALIMLPLSCPRTMKPLAKFSLVSVLSIVFLVLVIIYLYFSCVNPHPSEHSSLYTNWIEIRSFLGFIESLGTFVFTFVCQHTVNLAYESLPQSIQTPQTWRKVSTYSLVLATEASLAIGIFSYLTFGTQTPADVLIGYPSDLTLANIARLLLCLTMILTFPLPFLTCREMMVLILVDAHSFYYTKRLQRYNICRPVYGGFKVLRRKVWTKLQQDGHDINVDTEEPTVEMEEPRRRSSPWWKWNIGVSAVNDDVRDEWWDGANDATQALLAGQDRQDIIVSSILGESGRQINPSPLSSPASSISGELSYETSTTPVTVVPAPSWILPQSNGRQLVFLWHLTLTYMLWIVVTCCAIKSPSLGDVLDLVGAFTGTLLAFILPALFSRKLRGHSRQSLLILVIGGVVGVLGTVTSFVKFVRDSST